MGRNFGDTDIDCIDLHPDFSNLWQHDAMWLGIDVGTGGSRALLVDDRGRVRGVLAKAGVGGSQVKGIGLSGQMHGLVMLDGANQVIRPALIWCDQRSQAQVDFVNARIGREKVLEYTANPVLTGFTLPKLLWVRDNEPANFARVRKMLLPKDYVRFKLTGEFATEVSDASGTSVFDVVNRRWSFPMMDALGLDRSILPACNESAEVTGQITAEA